MDSEEKLPDWLKHSVVYKGISMLNYELKEIDEIEKMEIKEDDIWVCSFPRSGTTLTQELVYLVQTLDFERAKSVQLDERFPIINMLLEELPFYGGVKMVEALASPRFIKTHLHHFLLPEQLRNGGGKIIYSARNVRDTMWSLYKFYNWLGAKQGDLPFDEFFKYFMAEKVSHTPWSRHVREYWGHRKDGNILFLNFEETVKDMPGTVRQIASFLNKSLEKEDIKCICEHCSIENMKNNKMVNFSYYRKFAKVYDNHGDYINTGTGGSWCEHFTDEMNKRVDEMIKTEFAGSGFTFYNS